MLRITHKLKSLLKLQMMPKDCKPFVYRQKCTNYYWSPSGTPQ